MYLIRNKCTTVYLWRKQLFLKIGIALISMFLTKLETSIYHIFLFGCKCFTVCAAYMSKDCYLVYFGFF